MQVLAKLASNHEKQQLAYRHCLNNVMRSLTPISSARMMLQFYPLVVRHHGSM